MRVVALFRVSTERQANEGASLDAQERTYREHARRNGWTSVGEFRGTESATQASTERRVLQEVLACVRENAVDAVYVHEQSRLTRGDELEVALLMRELRERRLKIIVNGVVRDLASIDERFMVGIQSLVDRAESERIKERMLRGKREKARQGKRSCGAPPFGYVNPPPGDPGRGRLRVIPEQATVVRRVFDLAVSGKGDRAVAEALNEAGLAASRGGRWCKTAVRRVLDNPAYVGTSASGIWRAAPGTRRFKRDLKADSAILIENAHEAIVDRATWDAVHSRPRLPRTHRPRMLSAMLWVNGEPFSGDSSCHGAFYRAARGVKGSAWLRVESVDGAVWDAFTALATSPEFVQRLLAEAANPKEQAVITQEIDYLQDQIGKRQRRLDNLVGMRADGEINKQTFVAKRDEEERAIEGLAAELAGLRSKMVAADGTVAERVVRAVQVVLPGSRKLTTDQKRSILRSIVRRVDVTAERTGAVQTRSAGGRLAASGGPTWAVTSVALRLALPAQDAGESRDRQLGTTFSCSGPPALASR
jgi:DNA invertase Pin-like site-specific DNA recombinase